MAKITAESREIFNEKMKPYKELVQQAFDKEKEIRCRNVLTQDPAFRLFG